MPPPPPLLLLLHVARGGVGPPWLAAAPPVEGVGLVPSSRHPTPAVGGSRVSHDESLPPRPLLIQALGLR